jgi:WD40 repeat protein
LAVTYSPDGNCIVSSHQDKTVRWHDAKSGNLLHVLSGHDAEVSAVAYSPDGKILATASCDKTVKLWNNATQRLLRTLQGHTDWVLGASFSPDGKTLASCGSDKSIRLWDPATGREEAVLQGHTELVRTLAFSPDGKLLASTGADHSLKLWDVAQRKEMLSVAGFTGTAVAFSPDGATVAGAGLEQNVILCDARTGQPRSTITGLESMAWSLAFSPKGETLATGGIDGLVALWDPASGRSRLRLRQHTAAVTAIAFAPDASAVVTGGADKSLYLWRAVSGGLPVASPLAVVAEEPESVLTLAISPDGQWLASAGKSDLITLRALKSGEIGGQLKCHSAGIADVAFSPDGKTLASALHKGPIELFDVPKAESLRVLAGHGSQSVRRVVFSPDGRHLASCGEDSTAKMWDPASGALLWSTPPQANLVSGVAFSPDGRTLATSTGNWHQWKTPGELKCWDVETGVQRLLVGSHENEIKGLIFDRSGKRLLSFGPHGLRVWEIASQARQATLDPSVGIDSTVVLPDGLHVAAGDNQGGVALWNLDDGRKERSYEGHGDMVFVFRVVCSPDGSLLVSVGKDGAIKFWATGLGTGRQAGSQEEDAAEQVRHWR